MAKRHTFTLTIRTDGAAFCEDGGARTPESVQAEIARILREVSHRIQSRAERGRIVDANGNACGEWKGAE